MIGLLGFIIGVLSLLYAYVKYTYSYWDRKGIKTAADVNYLVGHFKPLFTQTKHISEHTKSIYQEAIGEPFVGIYGFFRPILMVRSPELIRNVLIKDFSNFADRGVYCDEKKDPLSGNLFQLDGDKWKSLRAKLTPTFTSGRLKAMFPTLVDCGLTVEKYLEKAAKNNESVDIRELAAGMTTNVITSVAFGIDVDSINNPSTSFRKFGRKVFEPSLMNGIRGAIFFAAPSLMKYLPIKGTDADVEKFILTMVAQNLEYREKNNISRKDFFQLLVQLRNKGSVTLDDQWESSIKTNEEKLSIEEIAAQVFVFFVAGFETSSSTMSYCLYELAKNQDVQKRVHEDIDKMLRKFNGEITYDCLLEMEYLEWCIDETLRKYPVASILNRKCMNDYVIPGTDKVIEKGTDIIIPLLGLHHDEKYYPNPQKFEPERFNAENSAGKSQVNRPNYAFGDGPRNCIGMRLGKMQTKVGLLLMLKQFRFDLEPHLMGKELEFDPTSFVIAPKENIRLRAVKRIM